MSKYAVHIFIAVSVLPFFTYFMGAREELIYWAIAVAIPSIIWIIKRKQKNT